MYVPKVVNSDHFVDHGGGWSLNAGRKGSGSVGNVYLNLFGVLFMNRHRQIRNRIAWTWLFAIPVLKSLNSCS